MMEIETPKIEVTENEDRCYAKIVAEPLEKGFGLTLGNALRRILLSALPGDRLIVTLTAQRLVGILLSKDHELGAV